MFPPAFGPRVGYLCKYLKINGWKPVVITEYIEDQIFEFLKGDTEVHAVKYYRKTGFAGKVEWGWTMLRDVLTDYKNRKIYREALKLTDSQRFDLILCSAYRTFPLPAAGRLARKTGLPLVVDLRDIMEQYTGNEFITHKIPHFLGLEKWLVANFKRRNLKIRNRVLRRAAHITTVSPWHVEVLKQFNPNISLIYNGFDSEIFYPIDSKEDIFYITYTGRLISAEMRNPDLLFQAMERIVAEGIITSKQFQVRWFTDEKSKVIIQNKICKYPEIQEFMCYHDYVSATEIPKILNESAILLILTNKADEKGPQGVMTTKFFEYLAVGKPILCVRGDEGCLEEVINKTKSGLSAHNVDEVYDFVKQHFVDWKSGKLPVNSSDKEEVAKFSREKQAVQFIEIFKQVVDNE
jgi:glycosyltransferase involved in cell wall biosynthesis